MAENGWPFWPDGEGMGANELAFRRVTNWCEHAFHRVGNASDSLGDMPPEEMGDGSGPRCFNCGSTAHVVGMCPNPIDHELVSLSRAMYNFYSGSEPAGRFHEREEWRLTRLRWLDEFEPGEVRGPTLRDALDLKEGDPGRDAPWLHNMLIWGYPKGWVGPENPRFQVEERILCHQRHSLGELKVFGNEDEIEVLDLDLDSFDACSVLSDTPTLDDRTPSPEPEHTSSAGLQNSSAVVKSECASESIRWANYQTDVFLSDHLTVYTGASLDVDMADGAEELETHFVPTETAEELLIVGSLLPWRHRNAFSTDTFPMEKAFKPLRDEDPLTSESGDEGSTSDMDISD